MLLSPRAGCLPCSPRVPPRPFCVCIPVPALMLNSCTIHHWCRATPRLAAGWMGRSGLVDWQTWSEPVFSARGWTRKRGEWQGLYLTWCLRSCSHTQWLYLATRAKELHHFPRCTLLGWMIMGESICNCNLDLEILRRDTTDI